MSRHCNILQDISEKNPVNLAGFLRVGSKCQDQYSRFFCGEDCNFEFLEIGIRRSLLYLLLLIFMYKGEILKCHMTIEKKNTICYAL